MSPITRTRGACTAVCTRSERGARTAQGVSVTMKVAGTAEEGVCRVLRGHKQLRCLAVGQRRLQPKLRQGNVIYWQQVKHAAL